MRPIALVGMFRGGDDPGQDGSVTSKFMKFQEKTIQEHSNRIPVGHIPHLLTVMCRDETQSRQCGPQHLRLAKHINFVHSYGKLPLSRIKSLDMSLIRGWTFPTDGRASYMSSLSTSSGLGIQNTSDKIFALVRRLAGASNTVKVSDVMERCTTKGYKPGQEDPASRS
ncbi:conserved hypothetical protein [Culex quinquefasciatus]|uniref:DNA replication licensing factor MCM7 n=1 Tax=Culex quinquefasciatus TaxID=7176 RepID=B0X800_CULQU|nr:conserved hypothetical protein [Culex quinquefasciatus]|eukprot:XP_001865772.1 conserved hypothetical protein [Culex quinquefasciatus]